MTLRVVLLDGGESGHPLEISDESGETLAQDVLVVSLGQISVLKKHFIQVEVRNSDLRASQKVSLLLGQPALEFLGKKKKKKMSK